MDYNDPYVVEIVVRYSDNRTVALKRQEIGLHDNTNELNSLGKHIANKAGLIALLNGRNV